MGRAVARLDQRVDNAGAAAADLVVVATPWDGAVATVRGLAEPLAGKVVVSMVNALVKEGRELLALVPPRGSMAAAVQAALPASRVSAAFHHLPASEMENLDIGARWPTCSSAPTTTEAERRRSSWSSAIDGLRPLDAGSLSQAAAVEALTAVLHHAEHPAQGRTAPLQLAGI